MLFNGNHAEAEPMLRGLHWRNFASCLTRHDEFAEAEDYNRSALDGMKRAFRTEHPRI
jgi:heme oxygenase